MTRRRCVQCAYIIIKVISPAQEVRILANIIENENEDYTQEKAST